MKAKTLTLLGGGLLLAFAASPSIAQTADLIGTRAAAGELALEDRGYTVISGHSEGNSIFTYWWNNRSDQCISVRTRNGIYDSIVPTSHRDCGRHDGRGDAAAGVAVGALLVGLAAAAHKSHHHDNDRHFDDWRREDAYERGYRAGHSHSKMYNWNEYQRVHRGSQRIHHQDYSSGYAAGQRDSWRNVQIKDSSSPEDED